jgi:ribonucleotide reductase beta subunit family protein with ferritin-like domain
MIEAKSKTSKTPYIFNIQFRLARVGFSRFYQVSKNNPQPWMGCFSGRID